MKPVGKARPAMKALNPLGIDEVPNLVRFLPPLGTPEFPLQALGLQLVLDQAIRALLEGVETKWTYWGILMKYQ